MKIQVNRTTEQLKKRARLESNYEVILEATCVRCNRVLEGVSSINESEAFEDLVHDMRKAEWGDVDIHSEEEYATYQGLMCKQCISDLTKHEKE